MLGSIKSGTIKSYDEKSLSSEGGHESQDDGAVSDHLKSVIGHCIFMILINCLGIRSRQDSGSR